jgi:L-ascorbate metabolism protein UlaG (beta-lactamase superfamily)
VVTDPFPPSAGLKLPKLDADLITVSHGHDNHTYVQAIGNGTYTVDGPGEYEVAGITVLGIPTYHDPNVGAERGPNTVYVIEVDDVRVCHLGDLGHRLGDRELEALGAIDLLLVPVGGHTTIDAAEAAEVVRQIEPRLVIPMHFAIPGLKAQLDPVDRFLKEMGVPEAEPQPRLAVQPSSAESETKVVLLEARR